MTLLIYILGGSVKDGVPSDWFKNRLDKALEIYKEASDSNKVFMISGRWTNCTDEFLKSEAKVGAEYIQSEIPEAKVIVEDISTESVGNLAFSKGLIMEMNPKRIVGVFPKVAQIRLEYLVKRIWGGDLDLEIEWIEDLLLDDQVILKKMRDSVTLYENLLEGIDYGDADSVIARLLYSTPYYFKGVIDDKEYFDKYYPGGYEEFLGGRAKVDEKK